MCTSFARLRRFPFPRIGVLSAQTTPALLVAAKPSPSAFIKGSQFSQSSVSWKSGPSHWDSTLEPAGPKCHCGEPAVTHTVTQGLEHNMGRQFFTCKHSRGSPQNCGYFAWADGTVAFGLEAWKRWGETHGIADWKGAMREYWTTRRGDS